jgi:hypothetical protein
MVMQVNTFVDKKNAIIIHTVTGVMTFNEIKSAYETISLHPEFREDMNSIWDLRDADASKLDRQDIMRIARYIETQLKDRSKFKAALIVFRDLEWDLSRIYQVASADLPAKIEIFNNLEDAKEYVTEPD